MFFFGDGFVKSTLDWIACADKQFVALRERLNQYVECDECHSLLSKQHAKVVKET